MNDIIKLILLNLIIIYFFYKDKKISIFLMSVLLVYYLYLKNNKIEGNSNLEEKKKEARYLNMLNIDRLLDNLISVYEKSEQDCIGEYSEFTPCDKKCGKTYKYQTYRVIEPGGPLGSRCLQDDGDRKKVLCDKEDNIYPCEIGGPCDEDADCITNSCDPETNRCVANRVCSHENLDLCNRIQCLDLNNQYAYSDKEFKFGSDLECKLENMEESEEEGGGEGGETSTDPVVEVLPDFRECPWYMEQDYGRSTRGQKACKMSNNNTIYLKENDGSLDLRRTQYNEPELEEGLYCKIGYKYNDDNNKGVTVKIDEDDQIEGNYVCINLINSGIVEDERCGETGSWPPLSFFKNNENTLISDITGRIPISDVCNRCNNGFQYSSSSSGNCDLCVAPPPPSSTPETSTPPPTDRYNRENQFIESETLINGNVGGDIGKNENCFSTYGGVTNDTTCRQWTGTCINKIGLFWEKSQHKFC